MTAALPHLPPLSLYIHVPWCVRKCPYCDFNSHVHPGELPEQAYLTALLDDLEQELPRVQGRDLETVFIGGGTPSLMSPAFFQKLFEGLRQHLTFVDGAEITLEANPGAVEQGRFGGFRDAGINRLSIGVQSFDPVQLKTLGRIHDDTAAHKAIESALGAGFTNFNLDLMHGLPGQTPDAALADLKTAMAWQPPHLSWYQLTLEPNTEFYSRPPSLPDDDRLSDIYDAGAHLLQTRGYGDYEVSAWCQPGQASRHNLNYWRFGDYLAIGAGAHGKTTFRDGRIERYWKTRQPEAYLNRIGSYLAGTRMIEKDDLALEFMMNALRLDAGVSESLFSKRTGLALESVSHTLAKLRQDGLLHTNRLQATEHGKRYLNSLLERFL
ncbi:MAG: radical SAM family heme chaperone HemW [Oleiphilaceae bacterium]|nr:radical SAM family heme chaperone HemW [Oleiphilaceae bacterium]